MAAGKTAPMTDALYDYLLSVSAPRTPLMQRLRDETAKMPNGGMQIPAEQGQFFKLLVELTGTKRALEIGVFTGYSALVVAEAMPADGRIIACDVSEEFTSTARRYWAEAGITDKIDLRIGPANDTLAKLIEEGHADTFDFAFIDADKPAYEGYYEAALKLVRPGGLIALDNMFQHGRVADPEQTGEGPVAIRALNAKIAADPRVTASLVPIGDGVMLARKH